MDDICAEPFDFLSLYSLFVLMSNYRTAQIVLMKRDQCVQSTNELYFSTHTSYGIWVNSLNIIFFCGIFFIRNATENTHNWCIEWFIIGKLCSGYMYYFKSPKWTKLCSIEWIKNFMVISFYRSSVMYLNPFRCSAWKHFNAFMEKTEIRQLRL